LIYIFWLFFVHLVILFYCKKKIKRFEGTVFTKYSLNIILYFLMWQNIEHNLKNNFSLKFKKISYSWKFTYTINISKLSSFCSNLHNKYNSKYLIIFVILKSIVLMIYFLDQKYIIQSYKFKTSLHFCLFFLITHWKTTEQFEKRFK